MVNSSININKTIKQLPLTSTYWTYSKAKPWHVTFGILVMAWYRYKNVVKLETGLYNPTPPVIDIRISSEYADIYKQYRKTCTDLLQLKKITQDEWQHVHGQYSTKMTDIKLGEVVFFLLIFNVLQKVLLKEKATRKRSQLQRPFLYRICV